MRKSSWSKQDSNPRMEKMNSNLCVVQVSVKHFSVLPGSSPATDHVILKCECIHERIPIPRRGTTFSWGFIQQLRHDTYLSRSLPLFHNPNFNPVGTTWFILIRSKRTDKLRDEQLALKHERHSTDSEMFQNLSDVIDKNLLRLRSHTAS